YKYYLGGIVMDENRRVLVVKEKYNFGVDHWKFPGGVADPGEEFYQTAQREIFEETGIETCFQSLVVIRHQHKYQFGCSDIYVLCYLKPVNDKNPNLELKMCTQEITAAAWIPVEELINQLSSFNRYALQKLLLSLDKNVSIRVEKIESILKIGKQSVYSINFDS
ncbi:nudix hydrolase 8-like protein, partial [Leptotrombidium deliense]